MKILTIVRHAKSERPEGYGQDAERPLTERGERDATRMGELLARLQPGVDWWLSSTARRTRQTSDRMLAACTYQGDTQWEATIYEASAEHLAALLTTLPQAVQHAVLVGHNPGVAELVAGLASGAPERLNLHMATGALAHLSLEIFSWNQLRWGCGCLELLVTPRSLKK
jgi:phosphohistidine phosphatase